MSVNKELINSISSLNSLESENINDVISTMHKNNQLTANLNDLLFKYNELKNNFYLIRKDKDQLIYDSSILRRNINKLNNLNNSFKILSIYLLNILTLIIITRIFY